jgi:transposase
MQTPLFVRPLTADERATLEAGLRSSSALTVRRGQILLANAEGQSTTTIAHDLRCTDQTVRNALQAFHQRGRAALQPQSSRPHTLATIFTPGVCESRRALLHQSPRTFGKPPSRWTLALAAEVSFAQGAHATARQRRGSSCGAPPLAGVVEAGQTLDHQSRSGVCPEKNGATN